MISFILKAAFVLIGAGVLVTITHDDRIKDPYSSILALIWFAFCAAVAYYARTRLHWW